MTSRYLFHHKQIRNTSHKGSWLDFAGIADVLQIGMVNFGGAFGKLPDFLATQQS